MIDSSLISAMLTSRCVFSMTLAASATRMLLALCVPAVMICAIERVDEFGDFRRRTRGHLLDVGHAVRLVARVDPLRAVADEEILVELEAREALEHRHALLFRRAGIDGRFVDHDVVFLQHAADRLARADERTEVGPLVVIDRRRDRRDEHVAILEVFHLARELHARGGRELFVVDFERGVAALAQRGDARAVDVEAHDRATLAEFHCKG